jgi:regulator of sigma E protease
MFSLLAPILVFGLVIFIHELGHFLAAKAVGVYAPRFSIGFGPALFRFRRGETEYVLALLPLGGFVRMASRLDEESAFLEGGSEAAKPADGEEKPDGWDPEAMIPFGPKPVPEHRWFESKPLIARVFIMIAGVTMNVLLAIVIVSSIAMQMGRTVLPSTVVGDVTLVPTMPELAQLNVGDTIRSIDGRMVATWNDVQDRIVSGHGPIAIQTNRGVVRIPTPSDSDRMVAFQSLGYFITPVIDSIVAGDRAAQGGLRRGDSIVAIDGAPIRVWTDLSSRVNASAEKPLRFDVLRGGARVTLAITPKATTMPSKTTGKDTVMGKIGAAARDISRRESIGLGQALAIGTRDSWNNATSIVGFLKSLVVGRVSLRQLGGPIAIGRASVTAARNGVADLFYLIALLSINVAVLNLLPIPILDGGQILLNVIESARGSPFTMKTREYILRFGLAAIALLFIVVMFNDTRGGFAKLFGWMFH